MLTTIWRSLQSHSNRFTKPNPRQRKRQQRQPDSFRPCETLEKRQFLSANTIEYTGESTESLIGTAYVTQAVRTSETETTGLVVLAGDNNFLSSDGVQTGTVGAEQLPTVELAQGFKTHQILHPQQIFWGDVSYSTEMSSFTSHEDAVQYYEKTWIDVGEQNVSEVQTVQNVSLLDLSKSQNLISLRNQIIVARDAAIVEKDSQIANPSNWNSIDSATASLARVENELDCFELATGWGVTLAEQIDLYDAWLINYLAVDHNSNPLKTGDFETTADSLLVSTDNMSSWQRTTNGIQIGDSVVYGSDADQSNPFGASSLLQESLAEVATKYITDIDGIFMPASPSLFESDGLTTEYVVISQPGCLELIGVKRPRIIRSTEINLGDGRNGPNPITIDVETLTRTVSGDSDANQTYVITNVANGKVEKRVGGDWVDVSSPPKSTTPLGLLQALQLRKISSTDEIRWTQNLSTSTQKKTFKLVGWHKIAGDVGETEVTVDPVGTEGNSIGTAAAKNLNTAIKGSLNSSFTGAGASFTDTYSNSTSYGVLIRNLDDTPPSHQSFSPASLIHNDINVPSGVYPAMNGDWGDGASGFNLDSTDIDRSKGYWTTPTLAAVYPLAGNTGFASQYTIDPYKSSFGSDASTTNAKNENWGYGVLYSHDSNSEKRSYPAFKYWKDGMPYTNGNFSTEITNSQNWMSQTHETFSGINNPSETTIDTSFYNWKPDSSKPYCEVWMGHTQEVYWVDPTDSAIVYIGLPSTTGLADIHQGNPAVKWNNNVLPDGTTVLHVETDLSNSSTRTKVTLSHPFTPSTSNYKNSDNQNGNIISAGSIYFSPITTVNGYDVIDNITPSIGVDPSSGVPNNTFVVSIQVPSFNTKGDITLETSATGAQNYFPGKTQGESHAITFNEMGWFYDLPYGLLTSDQVNNSQSATNDSSKYGAADKLLGNPFISVPQTQSSDYTGGPAHGAGAGIHASNDYTTAKEKNQNFFDYGGSTNSYLGSVSEGLLQDPWGQMNYSLRGSDQAWSNFATPFKNLLQGQSSWGLKNQMVDVLIPWVDNFKDQINVQNALWQTVFNEEVHQAVYWGWNEIPVAIDDFPTAPQAFAFVMPQYQPKGKDPNLNSFQFQHPSDIDPTTDAKAYHFMGDQLDQYHTSYGLEKGSIVLTVRQGTEKYFSQGKNDSNAYAKYFAADTWTINSPGFNTPNGQKLTYTITDGVITSIENYKSK